MSPIISHTLAVALLVIFIVTLVLGVVHIRETKERVIFKKISNALCLNFLLLSRARNMLNTTENITLYAWLPEKIMGKEYMITFNNTHATISLDSMQTICTVGNLTGRIKGGLIEINIYGEKVRIK